MKVLFEQESSKLVNYKLVEIVPRIYALIVPEAYERAMIFCRAQEYYESQFQEIKGRDFCLFEYMNLYRKAAGKGYFSYPSDWSGYNVPSDQLEACLRNVEEWNSTAYDLEMQSVIWQIRKHQLRGKFYLLGVDSIDSKTMDHEFSHGLFYTNKEYKTEMLDLVLALKKTLYEDLEAHLFQMGYCKQVIVDEIQAYLSTGMLDEIAAIRGAKAAAKNFQRVFKKYKKLNQYK